MKNPDNKPLRIVAKHGFGDYKTSPNTNADIHSYGLMLSNLAIAQSNLVKTGKDSAMPHFIAIVKELERLYGFHFEIMEPEGDEPPFTR